MKTEILEFTGNMLPEAGKLLAERHVRNRQALPLLPARFEDLQIATQAITELW